MEKQDKNKGGIIGGTDGFRKVESLIFRFEDEGDMIEGELLAVEGSQVYEGNKIYTLKTAEGNTYKVFGTVVLSDLMQSIRIGQIVRIVLTGYTPATKKGNNPTKNFEVFVKNKN